MKPTRNLSRRPWLLLVGFAVSAAPLAAAAESPPNIVLIVADSSRRDLGDSLQKTTGTGLRKPGFDDATSGQ